MQCCSRSICSVENMVIKKKKKEIWNQRQNLLTKFLKRRIVKFNIYKKDETILKARVYFSVSTDL